MSSATSSATSPPSSPATSSGTSPATPAGAPPLSSFSTSAGVCHLAGAGEPTGSMQQSLAAAAGGRHLAEQNKAAWQSFPADLLAGGILGGVAHTVVAPIERAKLVLQTQDSNMAYLVRGKARYKGMVDAILRITKEEGFWSLWRGNGSSVIRYYPSVALNFAFKDYYRTVFAMLYFSNNPEQVSSKLHRSGGNFAAGAAAGATSLLFTYPLDIAHTRLATDLGSERQFKGLRHFLYTIYRAEGARGLYQGFSASVHGIVVHRSLYFGGFDTAKQFFLEDEHKSSFWSRWALAQASTTTAGIVAYPFDTVRHRMMMQSGLKAKLYTSTFDCWRRIYNQGGLVAFYKGCLSNMFRGTGAALILASYDEVKWFLHRGVEAQASLDGR